MNLVSNINQALVYDFGSASIQSGFAGDLNPLCSIPSWYTVNHLDNDSIKFTDKWVKKNQGHLDVYHMLIDEYNFVGADIMTPFLDWTYNVFFDENDQPDLAQWPVLFSQPSYLLNNLEAFEKRQNLFAELAFDFHSSISFQHDASLACYAHGIHTGVVVDFGWCCLRIIPVIEGHPLRNAIKINKFGGSNLYNLLYKLIEGNGKKITTILEKKANQDEIEISQAEYCKKEVIMDMIKNNLRFDDDKDDDDNILNYIYFMAEKEPINLKDELKYLEKFYWEDSDECNSIQNLVKEAIHDSPIEYQGMLWKSVVTSGGLSKLSGFTKRLQTELEKIAPNGVKPNVILPKCREASGQFTTWVGGSIVASSENFLSSCISVDEWRENGSVANKFI